MKLRTYTPRDVDTRMAFIESLLMGWRYMIGCRADNGLIWVHLENE